MEFFLLLSYKLQYFF